MLFLGDWAPGEFIDSVKCEIDSDLFVINLEGAILSQSVVDAAELKACESAKVGPLLWNKVGPSFPAPSILTLANNHFMDLGVINAERTMLNAMVNGSTTLGFGETLDLARKPARFEYNGKQISIFAACENQFGEASNNTPGIAFIGPWIYGAIAAEKKLNNFVIVIFHGGLEDAFWSAPWTQDLLRSYVDVGADLVIAHHPHKPQAAEQYKGAKIYYSLGNFCVDPRKWENYPLALYSIGVNLEVVSGSIEISTRYFVNSIHQASNTLKILEIFPEEGNEILSVMEKSEEILRNPKLNLAVWEETCRFHWDLYLCSLIGAREVKNSTLDRIKNRVVYIFDRNRYAQRKKRMVETKNAHLYHAISNDTHRQLALGYLRNIKNERINIEAQAIVRSGLKHLLT